MEIKFKSISEAFRSAAGKFPKKTALVYLGEKYCYAKMDEFSEQVANSFYAMGVRKEDRVIIYSAHCPQWVITWLAIQKLGAVAVPVTHFYGLRDLKYIANDSGAETVFCMDTNYGYVEKMLADTKVKRVIVTGAADLLPGWKKVVGSILDKIPTGKFNLDSTTFLFNSLLKGKGSQIPALEFTGDELAEFVYTGGTTGFSKGVPISNAMLLDSFFGQRKGSLGVVPMGEDIMYLGAPLNHILGQTFGFGCLMAGETLVMLPKMSLDGILDHIERYKIKTMMGTPTMYRMILEHDRIDQYSLSSLKYCICGGDTVPRELANRWLKKFGVRFYEAYGATETCGGVALTPASETNIPEGTAGKIVSWQDVLVVNHDTLEPVPPNEPGELLVSSPHMVSGYWNKPEETRVSFMELQGKLWYRTGDIVRLDQGNWLHFVDRTGDIIKHKGYRVAASKVDNVLQEHTAVMASSTIGVSDPVVGQRIKSYVVIKDDIKGVDAKELLKWCRERLAPYEVPQYIEFRDMLPKSKVGKILKRELRDEEKRKVEIASTKSE